LKDRWSSLARPMAHSILTWHNSSRNSGMAKRGLDIFCTIHTHIWCLIIQNAFMLEWWLKYSPIFSCIQWHNGIRFTMQCSRLMSIFLLNYGWDVLTLIRSSPLSCYCHIWIFLQDRSFSSNITQFAEFPWIHLDFPYKAWYYIHRDEDKFAISSPKNIHMIWE
jgi:hypothetical protein